MKKFFFFAILCSIISLTAFSQKIDKDTATVKKEIKKSTKKKDIIKKGWNLGPLPIVAYDADRGFEVGALLNLYDFGDGSTYPNTRQQWYFEVSYYTKGSQMYKIFYDNKFSIPNVRFLASACYFHDTALDFYGFNGYMSYYDHERVKAGKDGKDFLYTPYYRIKRSVPMAKIDFIGNIWDNKFYWEAGYHFSWIGLNTINRKSINKGKEESEIFPDEQLTLYEKYQQWGIIPEKEAKGGFNSAIRLGLMYDTRDKEAAPSKGIWTEAHAILAPKFLGTTNPFYRYSVTFRHYVPIVKNDVLTFAYRLNYQGTFGKEAPFYVLPYMTVLGREIDYEGFGGYKTVRGLLRNKVQGLDVATYNVELRWRFIKFVLWKQNIALALNAFSDGTMATKNYDMTFKGEEQYRSDYDKYMALNDNYTSKKGNDLPHITAGGGFRFIMNQNFIVCVEYGVPFKKQDGNGSLYINIGYLF